MISLSFLLLAAQPAPWQEPAAPVATQQEPSAQTHYEVLAAEYDAAYQAWMEGVQKLFADAAENGETVTEYPDPPFADFMPRFLKGANKHAGTEQAVPYLVWVVQNGLFSQMSEATEAWNTLLDRHAASAGLEPLGPMLSSMSYIFPEKAAGMVAKLEKESSSELVRAWATWVRLTPIFKENGPKTEAFRLAKNEMQTLLAKVQDESLQRAFDSEVTVLEVFGMGMTAPDITAPDLNGVEFSLSDYKGKVLFVDFWGDW